MHVVSSFMKQRSYNSTADAHLPPTRVAMAAFALILESKRPMSPTQRKGFTTTIFFGMAEVQQKKQQILQNKNFPQKIAILIPIYVNRQQVQKQHKIGSKMYDLWRDISTAICCNFFMKPKDFESCLKNFPNKFKKFALMYMYELYLRPTLRYLKKLLTSCQMYPKKLELLQNYVEEKSWQQLFFMRVSKLVTKSSFLDVVKTALQEYI